jgi:6-phosphogluconolactonase (cycloisomerase 2 family)
VSNAHTAAGGPAPGSVSAYSVAASGALSPVAGSPFANEGVASCWVEISHDGQFLFDVNTASSTISSYSIAANGALKVIGNTPVANGHVGPEDARLSPDGTTLWVVDSGSDAISGFSVNGGVLTELPASPSSGPAGAAPSGIVVT